MRGLVMRRIAALVALAVVTPVAAQVDPAARGIAIQAKTSAQAVANRGYPGVGAYRPVTLPPVFATYTTGLSLGSLRLYEDPERTVALLGRDLKTVFGDYSTALSAPGATFYVALNGVDTNACTTVGAPCRSVGKAIGLANTAGVPSKIVVQGNYNPVTYDRITCGSAVTGSAARPTVDIALIARGGVVICSTADLAVTYAADATYTNTYTAVPFTTGTSPGAVQTVRDKRAKPDRWGHQPELLQVASAAIVDRTPGSWFYDSGTGKVFIRRADGAAVTTTNTNVLLPSNNFRISSPVNLYIGSDDGSSWGFEGGQGGVQVTPPASTTARKVAIVENAYARYSINGFSVDNLHGTFIVKDIEAGGTLSDGFNVHNTGSPSGISTLGIAINLNCGDVGTGGVVSVQCATTHENAGMVVLGGYFRDTGGVSIGSINASVSAVIGTTLGYDRGDVWTGTFAQPQALVSVSDTASDWLDGVRLQGSAPMIALRNIGTGAIYTRNMAPLMLPTINAGGGTIQLGNW